jgi:hypothetical protein
MDEDLLLSDLSVALGQLYLSVGVDLIPEEIIYKPLPEAITILRNRLARTDNFASYIDDTFDKLFTKTVTVCKTTTTSCKVKAILPNTTTEQKPTAIDSDQEPTIITSPSLKKIIYYYKKPSTPPLHANQKHAQQ